MNPARPRPPYSPGSPVNRIRACAIRRSARCNASRDRRPCLPPSARSYERPPSTLWRRPSATSTNASSSRALPGHQLLDSLLRQLEQNAAERLFLLLGLLYPKEDFGQIYRGLSDAKDSRATSVELLVHILSEPLRSAVVGLVDDTSDAERRRHAGRYHLPLGLGYEALLAHLLASDSEAVQDIATFHVGELGLTSLRSQVEAVPNPQGTRIDVSLALARLLRFERREPAT
jgi:hypothetical protein